MNERVRELRKALSLTLEKFGANLGVTKTAIHNIENGNRNLTDQMFLSIVREYNVNPDWLRNGTGPMFLDAPDRNDFMTAAAGLSDDPLVISFLVEYAKLRPDERAVIQKYIDNILQRYKEEKDAT